MQVQIKFTVGGANSVCGGFSAGDMLRCSAAMAKHLVEDAKCAEYAATPANPPEVEAKRPRKTKE